MQILGPTQSDGIGKPLEWGPEICALNSAPGDSDTWSTTRNPDLNS